MEDGIIALRYNILICRLLAHVRVHSFKQRIHIYELVEFQPFLFNTPRMHC